MLGVYAAGLALTFVAGVVSDFVDRSGQYAAGGLWDLLWMAPYVVMALAAGIAFDEKLFEPADEAPQRAGLPVVSMIAITLLVAIPAIDEIARRLFAVSPPTQLLRTRLALAMMIPFGVVVVVREFLSRRALVRASQELVATREQLVQNEKLAAVGQLVSGVAHELNNPLQGVLGYAELMLAARPGSLEAEELRAIRDNANRAASIVRNLLTFAGRTSSARGWQQMNRVVRDAVAVRRTAAAVGEHRHSRRARRSPAARLHRSHASRRRARQFDPERGERDRGTAIRQQPAVHGARQCARRDHGDDQLARRAGSHPGRSVRQRQRPQGRGSEPRVRSVLYDSRSRAGDRARPLGVLRDRSRAWRHHHRPQRRGRRCGLYHRAARHGRVAGDGDSAAAGACRRAPAPSYSTVALAEEPIEVPPKRPKALVVDDEESNAALVRRVLAGTGYDVESTTLSRRALVMIERTAYDAVICDVKMPELSGQELYGRVCQIRPEMARRFIFITGDIDGEDTREFLDQSRCSYFMKPFNLERLTSAVDMLTGSRAPDNIG